MYWWLLLLYPYYSDYENRISVEPITEEVKIYLDSSSLYLPIFQLYKIFHNVFLWLVQRTNSPEEFIPHSLAFYDFDEPQEVYSRSLSKDLSDSMLVCYNYSLFLSRFLLKILSNIKFYTQCSHNLSYSCYSAMKRDNERNKRLY